MATIRKLMIVALARLAQATDSRMVGRFANRVSRAHYEASGEVISQGRWVKC